jgi:5-methylcytosine-specific restriction endonuclease McrA
VADRRYSTQAWKRLRLQVLALYGYVCQIQGPRCAGRANTVHHILPSSTHPELFWEPSNLQAACGACNYAGGAYQTAHNRRSARAQADDLQLENERLERIVATQQARIEELAQALVEAKDGPATEPARKRAQPAIR